MSGLYLIGLDYVICTWVALVLGTAIHAFAPKGYQTDDGFFLGEGP